MTSRSFAGQMFVRRVGTKAILVGIIDYPENSGIQSEALHTFHGRETEYGDFMLTTTAEVKDIKEQAKGKSIDGLLTSPIWKVGP